MDIVDGYSGWLQWSVRILRNVFLQYMNCFLVFISPLSTLYVEHIDRQRRSAHAALETILTPSEACLLGRRASTLQHDLNSVTQSHSTDVHYLHRVAKLANQGNPIFPGSSPTPGPTLPPFLPPSPASTLSCPHVIAPTPCPCPYPFPIPCHCPLPLPLSPATAPPPASTPILYYCPYSYPLPLALPLPQLSAHCNSIIIISLTVDFNSEDDEELFVGQQS